MLQSIRTPIHAMPPFGNGMSLSGLPQMDGHNDSDAAWQWLQRTSAHSQRRAPTEGPTAYDKLAMPTPMTMMPPQYQQPIYVPQLMDQAMPAHPPPRQQTTEPTRKTQPPFKATWHGYLDTTRDAMTILEGALQGRLSHISRRPHDKERVEMLVSGTVLVYEENASGIKRWTDAVHWSPSRVMNNCLIYRQLVRALKPEEKRSAMNPACGTKRKRKEGSVLQASKNGDRILASDDEYVCGAYATPPTNDFANADPNAPVYANFAQTLTPDQQRRFCGSLIDSYEFKEGGLLKKTISVRYQGTTHHIIAYYSLEDVVAGKLRRPCQDPRLSPIHPRSELLTGWKISLDDEEGKDLAVETTYSSAIPPTPTTQHQLALPTPDVTRTSTATSHPQMIAGTQQSAPKAPPFHQQPMPYASPHQEDPHGGTAALLSQSKSRLYASQEPSPSDFSTEQNPPQSLSFTHFPHVATSHQHDPEASIPFLSGTESCAFSPHTLTPSPPCFPNPESLHQLNQGDSIASIAYSMPHAESIVQSTNYPMDPSAYATQLAGSVEPPLATQQTISSHINHPQSSMPEHLSSYSVTDYAAIPRPSVYYTDDSKFYAGQLPHYEY